MKKNIESYQVQLKNLKPDGESFEYKTQEQKGLKQKLVDLIGKREAEIYLYITPIGNAFQINGHIKTGLQLECCRCGSDMDYPLNLKVNEILVVESKRPRGSKQSKNQESEHWANEGPFCNYLESYTFDLAEYIHEQIAANTPFIAECGTAKCEKISQSGFSSSNMNEYEQETSPFEVLRNFSTKQ